MRRSSPRPGSSRPSARIDDGGFSLIEAIVSLGIMALISASVFSLMTLTYLTTTRNELRTHAVTLAAQEVERLRGLPFTDIHGETTGANPTVTIEGVEYEIDADSLTVTGFRRAEMLEVRVVVTWDDHGNEQEFELRSLFTNVNEGVT